MRVIQLVNSVDVGDAVSRCVFELERCVRDLGYQSAVHSYVIDQRLAERTRPVEELRVSADDVVLLHLAAGTALMDVVASLGCRKVLLYHNITPARFFEGIPEAFRVCTDGRAQLAAAVGRFDAYLGDSTYNCQELAALGCPSPRVLPIVFDAERLLRYRPPPQPREAGSFRLLFVGRIVPNKRIQDVLEVFAHLRRGSIPGAQLTVVGEYRVHPPYYERLRALVDRLGWADSIEFTGKVDDPTLARHYAAADAFLSMSAHEGFCLPLLESMAFGVPTFACAAGAVRETMGNAGVLITERRLAEIAELIHVVTSNVPIRERVVSAQYEHVGRFSRAHVTARLKDVLEGLPPRTGHG